MFGESGPLVQQQTTKNVNVYFETVLVDQDTQSEEENKKNGASKNSLKGMADGVHMAQLHKHKFKHGWNLDVDNLSLWLSSGGGRLSNMEESCQVGLHGVETIKLIKRENVFENVFFRILDFVFYVIGCQSDVFEKSFRKTAESISKNKKNKNSTRSKNEYYPFILNKYDKINVENHKDDDDDEHNTNKKFENYIRTIAKHFINYLNCLKKMVLKNVSQIKEFLLSYLCLFELEYRNDHECKEKPVYFEFGGLEQTYVIDDCKNEQEINGNKMVYQVLVLLLSHLIEGYWDIKNNNNLIDKKKLEIVEIKRIITIKALINKGFFNKNIQTFRVIELLDPEYVCSFNKECQQLCGKIVAGHDAAFTELPQNLETMFESLIMTQ